MTVNINLWRIKKSYFWFPGLSRVTKATSLSRSTQDFLQLSFHMFPYNEILKIKSDLIFETSTPKYTQIANVGQISEKKSVSYERLKFRPTQVMAS